MPTREGEEEEKEETKRTRRKRKRKRKKEEERGGRGGDGEGTTTTTTAAVARGVTNAETKKNTDEDDDVTEATTKVTSTQTIIVVSIVLWCNSSPDKSFGSLSECKRGSRCNLRVSVDNAVLTFFFKRDVSYRTLFVSRGEQRTSRKRDESSGDFIRIR